MAPLADTHVHLLAGRDDGPRTADEAVAMCRMLVAEGARSATALAHQNASYPDNTPDALRAAAADLVTSLKDAGVPLAVYPSAEILLTEHLVSDWTAGRTLSMGDRRKWLLVEMPHGQFVDLRPLAAELKPLGVRIVLAHAERYDPLLDDPALAELFIAAGCLLQVTADALADPPPGHEPVLKRWAKSGMIHLLGSDGHNLDRRPPRLRAGHRVLAKWIGAGPADVIAALRGSAVLQGLTVNVPVPRRPKASWFTRLFGG
jgi:protein-tyrosine phosphatase